MPHVHKEAGMTEKDNDRAHRVLDKICKYLTQQNVPMPASLWHEMLDVIQESEKREENKK